MNHSIVEFLAGIIVSITVLMIFAQDRLDGDELYKGCLAGAGTVAAMKVAQNGKFKWPWA